MLIERYVHKEGIKREGERESKKKEKDESEIMHNTYYSSGQLPLQEV